MPPKRRHNCRPYGLLRAFLLLVLTLLIGNTAAGLAGRLAGRLAFAAAALFGALTKITGIQSLNMFHDDYLRPQISKAILSYVRVSRQSGVFLLYFACGNIESKVQ